jgi:hypothetical protein
VAPLDQGLKLLLAAPLSMRPLPRRSPRGRPGLVSRHDGQGRVQDDDPPARSVRAAEDLRRDPGVRLGVAAAEFLGGADLPKSSTGSIS